jgi:hypothetical protein
LDLRYHKTTCLQPIGDRRRPELDRYDASSQPWELGRLRIR